jgi:glycine/D-amino acid oxidase-like deaminating enzyme
VRVLVIGSGIFGVTAALELHARGCHVTLADPGPLPHPLAESTDLSKIVRCDYGADEDYTLLGERALDGWRRWNATWRTPRFHETGVTFLTRAPMQPGGFEHASYTLLARRGHHVERLDAAAIAARFPAYRPGAYVDGYYHREGGWAESGAVVAQLVHDAVLAGVTVRGDLAIDQIVDGGALAGGELLAADAIAVCAGAWATQLVPELAGQLRAVGQPVFHLQPADRALFDPARFPVFGADISRTGYYGFPIHRDGIVKIANHGTGIEQAPDAPRHVTAAQEADVRDFLRGLVPRPRRRPDHRPPALRLRRHPRRPVLDRAPPPAPRPHRRHRRLRPRLQVRPGPGRADRRRRPGSRQPVRAQVPLAHRPRHLVVRRRRPLVVAAVPKAALEPRPANTQSSPESSNMPAKIASTSSTASFDSTRRSPAAAN